MLLMLSIIKKVDAVGSAHRADVEDVAAQCELAGFGRHVPPRVARRGEPVRRLLRGERAALFKADGELAHHVGAREFLQKSVRANDCDVRLSARQLPESRRALHGVLCRIRRPAHEHVVAVGEEHRTHTGEGRKAGKHAPCRGRIGSHVYPLCGDRRRKMRLCPVRHPHHGHRRKLAGKARGTQLRKAAYPLPHMAYVQDVRLHFLRLSLSSMRCISSPAMRRSMASAPSSMHRSMAGLSA